MSQHHDPVHPDSDHLTPELVADLDEGLLDATSTEHARPDLGAPPHRTSDEIRERMSGNLCRCGAYSNIFEAIEQVAGRRA
jgi:xanthine dehydrogenase YagT iron-sulfur-binding subunit